METARPLRTSVLSSGTLGSLYRGFAAVSSEAEQRILRQPRPGGHFRFVALVRDTPWAASRWLLRVANAPDLSYTPSTETSDEPNCRTAVWPNALALSCHTTEPPNVSLVPTNARTLERPNILSGMPNHRPYFGAPERSNAFVLITRHVGPPPLTVSSLMKDLPLTSRLAAGTGIGCDVQQTPLRAAQNWGA
jgi:hypothetical protein